MQKFSGVTRREFLKLISLMPVGIFSRSISKLTQQLNPDVPNIIILVFDAWSHRHVSLYGYPRQTMPVLEKFAQQATVYHNHYSAGTFTSSGTASLLTGLYPWSHRVIHLGAGVTREHATHNIFSALSQTHSTLGYSQNEYADQLLYSLSGELDEHVHNWAFGLQNSNLYSPFHKNPRIAFASFEDNIVETSDGNDSSLFLGPLLRLYFLRKRAKYVEANRENYPIGLPNSSEMFLLEDVVDGAIQMLKGIQSPTLAYFHFYPPHDPYCPTKEFYRKFADGWKAPHKPIHDLSEERREPFDLDLNRRAYDEYLASWDNETSRLFDYLRESGLTENSYIFVTADHGELFERGIIGHFTKLIYDPLIHIPLIVSRPRQATREDIHALTSSVDILPTVANLLGQPIPEWAEGKLIPGFGGKADEHRSIFSVDAKYNSSFTPLRNYSISITRDAHRLIHYSFPKDDYEKFEFYDLNSDPNELKDLYSAKPTLALEMQDELMQKIEEVNKPYRR